MGGVALRDFYRVLQINRDSSFDEIKQAYKSLARKYHPDLNAGPEQAKCEAKMKDINEAANILLDVEKRKQYDEELFAEESHIRQCVYRKQEVQPEKPYKTKTNKELSILISIFVGLILIATSIIGFGVYKYFIEPSKQPSTHQNIEYINFGLSEADVISLLGEPLEKTKHLLCYDGYQIIVKHGKLEGWLDASGELNVGPQTTPPTNALRTGDNILKIIYNYGNPDTYSSELAIYDNVVLMLSNGIISEILILE